MSTSLFSKCVIPMSGNIFYQQINLCLFSLISVDLSLVNLSRYNFHASKFEKIMLFFLYPISFLVSIFIFWAIRFISFTSLHVGNTVGIGILVQVHPISDGNSADSVQSDAPGKESGQSSSKYSNRQMYFFSLVFLIL